MRLTKLFTSNLKPIHVTWRRVTIATVFRAPLKDGNCFIFKDTDPWVNISKTEFYMIGWFSSILRVKFMVVIFKLQNCYRVTLESTPKILNYPQNRPSLPTLLCLYNRDLTYAFLPFLSLKHNRVNSFIFSFFKSFIKFSR